MRTSYRRRRSMSAATGIKCHRGCYSVNMSSRDARRLTTDERQIVSKLLSDAGAEQALHDQIGVAEVVNRETEVVYRVDLDVDPLSAERGLPSESYLVSAQTSDGSFDAIMSVARGWLNFIEVTPLSAARVDVLPSADTLELGSRTTSLNSGLDGGSWSEYRPRMLRPEESALIGRLLRSEIEDASTLLDQLSVCDVVSEYRDDRLALELEVDRRRAPRSSFIGGVLATGEWDDGGGFPFQLLVRVYHGWLSEFEIYSPDDRTLSELPPAEQVEVRLT